MLLRPRAKINLTLEVGPRGADGYHPLSSIFLRVGLSDELTVELADGRTDSLTVTGLAGCPVEGNLVLRAFAALRERIGQDLPALTATLDKQIPMAAGLGGGSSDGAAAIDAALSLWAVGLSPHVRREIELELGADVPFFASNAAAALVTGRGEFIEPRPTRDGVGGVLLVTPPFGLGTGQVFARFDELDPARDSAQRSDANDLWTAATTLAPALAVLRELLAAETSRPWQMSGSGSTLFAVYPSVAEATADGRKVVSAESESLEGAIINAVDLEGPDPHWRYP